MVFVVAARAPVGTVAAQEGSTHPPIVVVMDSGALRFAPDLLLRAIGSAVVRGVVRVTESRARAAMGTLTLAHKRANCWLVREEIVDPFAAAHAPHQHVAIPPHLWDPFEAPLPRLHRVTDVLDPWGG